MDSSIVVGIIHGSQLVRDGIADLLNKQSGLRVTGVFGSARDALDRPLQEEHVLLYDLGTSHQDGLALVHELRERIPQAKVLVFGVTDDVHAILECVRAGVSACILDDVSLDDLLAAIQSVSRGTPSSSPKVVTALFSYVAGLQKSDDERPPATPLTAREEQILQLMAEGLDNKAIAQQLYLQPQTVKNYVHQVLQKMNLRNRLEVIRTVRSTKH